MKFIKPYYKILEPMSSIKSIEFAARNCYDSQVSITTDNTSANQLVESLINSKHFAMLEFGKNVCLKTNSYEIYEMLDFLFKINSQVYKFMGIFNNGKSYYITLNPRTIFEVLCFYNEYKDSCPALIQKLKDLKPWQDNFEEKYAENSHVVEPEFFKNTEFYYNCKYVCVELNTTRSTLAQITRHRNDVSFAVQSMRFIDLSNKLEMVIPSWFSDGSSGNGFEISEELTTKYLGLTNYSTTLEGDWITSCLRSAEDYKKARKRKQKKEEARDRLLSCTKTKILIKASLRQWTHIFNERASKAADPEISRLMIPLKSEFCEIFGLEI